MTRIDTLNVNLIRIPEQGEKITIKDDKMQVPENPIPGYIEGDGIGPAITRACLRVWDAAIDKACGGFRSLLFSGVMMQEYIGM